MSGFLHRLFAMALCSLLALPPGLCQVLHGWQGAKAAPMKVSCCHASKPQMPCHPGNLPDSPTVKCCCPQDTALARKSIQPTDPLLPGDFVDTASSPLLAGSLLPCAVDSSAVDTGPSLQILLCVWRC